jgi:hypothetical protein
MYGTCMTVHARLLGNLSSALDIHKLLLPLVIRGFHKTADTMRKRVDKDVVTKVAQHH